MLELSSIRAAAARIVGRVHRTPIMSARAIGERADVTLLLKCECFQKTGSFKVRGALNKVMSLSSEERSCGLVTVSAGNHAQAVAWAGREMGVRSIVVMPTDAPRSKLEAVQGYGAEVILHDDRTTLFDRLHEVEKERGAIFVHPFDDPVVLAGAGTLGLEIVQDAPALDALVVPVGGGGLMSGVATAIDSLRPETRVIAVELEEGPGLKPALEAGKPVPAPRPAHTLADGMTPPFVGALPLEIARSRVDEIVTVTESEIIAAIELLVTRAKLWVEGAGAAATAAVLVGKVSVPARGTVLAIVSGGNIDADRLLRVLAREG